MPDWTEAPAVVKVLTVNKPEDELEVGVLRLTENENVVAEDNEG